MVKFSSSEAVLLLVGGLCLASIWMYFLQGSSNVEKAACSVG